jgi:integrase
MASIVYKNEVIKRKFFGYVRNSKGFAEKTIECYEKAILLWADFSHNADFIGFNKTAAEGFKDWLKAKKKANSQKEISISYRYDILRYLKVFFVWLSKQKGYKKIDQTAIDYLNLPKADVKIATQPRKIEVPSLEDIKAVIEGIRGSSEVEKRDRALISLIFLTGARISAVRTLPMKSFNKDKLTIDQNPVFGVKTKFSKRIITPLISYLYKEPLNYFLEWFDYLKEEKKFEPDDPIFPATKIENGVENLSYYNTGQVEPIFWESSSSPRKVIEKRFGEAGIKHYKPHAIRHSLIKRLSKLPLTEEQKKAISQSLGHEDVRTTFGSYGYGKIDEDKQIEIIKNIDFEGQKKDIKYVMGLKDIEQIAEMINKSNDSKT